MTTPTYASAVLGRGHPALRHEEEIAMEGIFSDIGHAIGGAVKAVEHVVGDVGKGIGSAASAVAHVGADIGSAVAKGATAIDHALMEAAKHVKDLGAVLHLAQIGISFIPGIGQGVSAAIGAGLALAEGKPITEALIAGVKGALPGGPIVADALDVGLRGAVDLASGKSLDKVALDAARNALPGGELAKSAFDMGLSLAQAKLTQTGAAAGRTVGHLVPHDPIAMSAFAMTRRLRQGQSPVGASHAALTRLHALQVARHPTPPPAPRQAALAPRPMRARMTSPAAASASSTPILPIALGAVVAAAAGGGAWWWWTTHRAP